MFYVYRHLKKSNFNGKYYFTIDEMLVNVFSHLVPTLGNGGKTKTNDRKQILPFFYMTGGKMESL